MPCRAMWGKHQGQSGGSHSEEKVFGFVWFLGEARQGGVNRLSTGSLKHFSKLSGTWSWGD